MLSRESGDIELITSVLIEEIVGKNGLLDQKFDELIEKSYPLGRAEAENMLCALLELAVGHRVKLTERIAKNAESGELFKLYYQKMNRVNELSAEAYVALKQMEKARDDYEFQHGVSDAVIGMTYTGKNFSIDEAKKNQRITDGQGESWDKMNNETK